jgi:hypothetical protein
LPKTVHKLSSRGLNVPSDRCRATPRLRRPQAAPAIVPTMTVFRVVEVDNATVRPLSVARELRRGGLANC